MFCGKCGNQIPDGVAFCGNCGEPVAQTEAVQNNIPVSDENPTDTQPVVENPVAEEPVTENTTAENPAAENPAAQAPEAPYGETAVLPDNDGTGFAAPNFEEEPPKKKKSKILRNLLFVAVPLALVAAIILNLGTVAGLAIKTFASPSAYFKYVETKAFADYSDSATDIYDAFLLENLNEDYSMESEIKLVVNDKLSEMLESYVGTKLDLSWLNDIVISLDGSVKDNLESAALGLDISKQRILSLDVIMDMSEQEMFMAISEFSDKYIKYSLNGATGYDDDSSENYYDLIKKFGEEILPDADTLDKLICKYTEIAIENITEVTKSKDTLEIDGIKQNVTVLKFTIDAELLTDIAEDILKEAKNDAEIKKIVKNLQDVLTEQNVLKDEDADLYEEFQNAIDEGLKELDEGRDEITDEEYVTVYDYVNGSSEIIGRKIEVMGDETAYYATVRSGKKFAFEAEISGVASITGSGTEQGDILNGKYKVNVNGTTYAELEIEDFDTEKARDGYINGVFRFRPSDELIYLVGGSGAASAISFIDPALELKYETSSKKAEVALNILDGDDTLIGLELNGKLGDAKNITKPSDKNTIDSNDSDAMTEWSENIDLDAIVEKLKKTDIPSEYINMIESLISMSQGGYDSYDDYDYSYDDYDYEDYDYEYDIDDFDYSDYESDYAEYEYVF